MAVSLALACSESNLEKAALSHALTLVVVLTLTTGVAG
jgi:hypothetical protein